MMTRYEAWLNKKSLSAVDPSLYILDISYSSPRFILNTVDKPGRNGQYVTGRHARNNSVVISFEIHEQDTARRQEICRRVQQWAMGGGILTTRDRHGQRLRVICDEPSAISSALKWTQPLKISFTAYDQPFWEDEYYRSTMVNGSDGKASLYVPGFGAETRVEASVKNVSGGTINALTLAAGSTTMSFEGLELQNGATLDIDYDENGLLRIRAGDVSKMSCRTSASDDDLMIRTGQASDLSVSAPGAVSVAFRAKGLYL